MGKLFLFLDYDGTLTRFRREPMEARPSKRMVDIISVLAGRPEACITIISGRDIGSLLELFKDFDHSMLNWSGVHGMQTRFSGSSRIYSAKSLPGIDVLKKDVSGIIGPYPCFILEDKGLSFAIHYRKCRGNELLQLDGLGRLLEKYRKNSSIEIMYMKKVIEVKPAGINKGNAINTILSSYGHIEDPLVICMGDDITDEYLFRANPEGINIKVGNHIQPGTLAGYYLKGVSDVYWFLKTVSSLLQVI